MTEQCERHYGLILASIWRKKHTSVLILLIWLIQLKNIFCILISPSAQWNMMPCTLLVIAQILSCISVMPCMLETLGMLDKLLCTWPESDMQPLLGGRQQELCVLHWGEEDSVLEEMLLHSRSLTSISEQPAGSWLRV